MNFNIILLLRIVTLNEIELAPSALAGVGLSLDPQGKVRLLDCTTNGFRIWNIV